jgi:GT2 family glycosyltransferase
MKSEKSHPLVYVVVLNWNLWSDTVECIESLFKVSYPNFSILLVDNGSTDKSVQVLSERFPDLPLLRLPENRYYAGGNNAGIAQALAAGAEYIMVLNNDTVVHPDFLNSLVAAMEKDPSLAAVGGTIYFHGQDNLIQSTGENINFRTGRTYALGHKDKDMNQFGRPRQVDYITGAAILLRSETLKRIGLLDESFMLYCEEADWCLRAQKIGYRVMFIPNSGVFHKASISTNSIKPLTAFLLIRNKIWLIKRHANIFQRLYFNISGVFYRYPRAILGTLYRKDYSQFFPVIRGIVAGYLTHR